MTEPILRAALAKMTERFHWPEPEAVLATGSFALFATCAMVVIFADIPEANEKYVMLMLGALIGIVKDTFARYFSSTKDGASQQKDLAGLAHKIHEGKD